MFLHGGTGTGKTYAAAIVYQHWPATKEMRHGDVFDGNTGRYNRVETAVNEPMFLDCQTECADLSQRKRDGVDERRLRELSQCSLLVLDEIGRRQMTEPQLDSLKDIIDRRGEKPTLLTSNKSPAELIKVLDDQKTVDRIQGTVIEFTGGSQRAAKTVRLKM